MVIQRDRVKFKVGGKIFVTTATTLANAGRDSMIGALLDENWILQSNGTDEEYFIDGNPTCFTVLLDLLPTGELHIPANVPEKILYRDALFYSLLDHARTAKWGPFEGNQLRLDDSVTLVLSGEDNQQICTAVSKWSSPPTTTA